VVETIFLQAKTNKKGALIIDSSLAEIFNNATKQLPENLDDKNIHRLSFLLSKMFPVMTDQQIGNTFSNYYRYRQVKQQLMTSNQEQTSSEADVFNRDIELKNKFLGKEITNKMFGQKDQLTRYLIARKLVIRNKQLSPQDKQKKLSALKNEFLRQRI